MQLLSREKYLKQIGLKIRNLRISKNITQAELASLLNRDQQSIQRIEKGRVNFSIYFLYELSEAFEVKVEELLKISSKK